VPNGSALKILKPETVIRWHRAGFRTYWRRKSRARGGRPKTPLEIRIDRLVFSGLYRLAPGVLDDRTAITMAKWTYGEAHRLVPTGVP
jgi:hypothetical protein